MTFDLHYQLVPQQSKAYPFSNYYHSIDESLSTDT